eukprot:12335528-Karenia_brevis.AAC.1
MAGRAPVPEMKRKRPAAARTPRTNSDYSSDEMLEVGPTPKMNMKRPAARRIGPELSDNVEREAQQDDQ